MKLSSFVNSDNFAEAKKLRDTIKYHEKMAQKHRESGEQKKWAGQLKKAKLARERLGQLTSA